jgi:hypothetical protein
MDTALGRAAAAAAAASTPATVYSTINSSKPCSAVMEKDAIEGRVQGGDVSHTERRTNDEEESKNKKNNKKIH